MARTAEQILAAAAGFGLAPTPARAQALAEEVTRMLAAADRAAAALAFESEPADFQRALREAGR